MKLETTLDRLHRRTVQNRLLQIFASFCRVLLALAFVPPSIPKITHQPFTILPTSNPVGYYFDALYKTGFYYDFIGWSQLTAALLLLIPRTSHIGALMFLPIIINITVLTNSIGFRGTWLITILMSCACLYLVSWDYPRWKGVLFSRNLERTGFTLFQLALIPFSIAAGTFVIVFVLSTSLGPQGVENLTRAAFLAIGGFVFGLLVAIHQRFMVIETGHGRAQE